MLMAIAVVLLAIAVWVFVRGIHDLVVIPHGTISSPREAR
jgi:hypothetical protein